MQSDQPIATAPLVLAFASGKGGVGKTSIVANLGISLAASGRRVCVFDADTNLANINILLRLRPEFTLEHFLRGEKGLEDIMLAGPGHIRIIPAASGISDLVSLTEWQRTRILDALRHIEDNFDYLLIDCAAGINETVLTFLLSAPYVVLVITTEPTSLTDAYSLLKVLLERGLHRKVYAVVNRATSRSEALEVYGRFRDTAVRYLGIRVHTMGYILLDRRMNEAVHRQTAAVIRFPDSRAARCIAALARVLDGRPGALDGAERFSALWQGLADRLPGHAPDESARSARGVSEFEVNAFLGLMEQAGEMVGKSSPADRDMVFEALDGLRSCCREHFECLPPGWPESPKTAPSDGDPETEGAVGLAPDRQVAERTGHEEPERAGLTHAAALAARLATAETG